MIVPYSPGGLPFVDVSLTHGMRTIHRVALVDSGSTINVLPYEDGREIGLSREGQQAPLKDEGFLRGAPVYAVLLTTSFGPFSPVDLAFAWTGMGRDDIRLILGQVNFFEHFDVTFRVREKSFEITPSESSLTGQASSRKCVRCSQEYEKPFSHSYRSHRS